MEEPCIWRNTMSLPAKHPRNPWRGKLMAEPCWRTCLVKEVPVGRVTPGSKGTTTEERELEPCVLKVRLKCCVQSGADTPEMYHSCISEQLKSCRVTNKQRLITAEVIAGLDSSPTLTQLDFVTICCTLGSS
ncbi:unnamed protein product [Lota lota]